MYRIFCLFAILCISAICADPSFHDCGSTVGRFTSVTVSGCDKEPCILKRESNATITITFSVDEDVTDVKSEVHGVVSGVPVPFPIDHPDACNFPESGITCPLTKAGGPYTYTNTLYVKRVYPRITLKVRWELKDEQSRDIVCVDIESKIQ